MIVELAKRISEIFPLSKMIEATNKSRLEYFLQTRGVTSVADVEHWTREFERKEQREYHFF